MWTRKPGEIDYSINTFFPEKNRDNSIIQACKDLWDQGGIFFGSGSNFITNDEKSAKSTFNAMLGINLEIDFSATEFGTISNELSSLDIDRTQRFYSFWNNPKVVNPDGGFSLNEQFIPSSFGLGLIKNFGNIKPQDGNINPQDGNINPNDLKNLYNLNILVTYILVLVFDSMGSSADSLNINNPLNIFTERNDISFFCKASDTIRQFVDGTKGLGNFPIFSPDRYPKASQPASVQQFILSNWNTGYLSKYCTTQYATFCTNKITPFTDDKCIQDYRKKMANSPNALNWCGCFTPLPTWVSGIFNVNKNIPPNTCDNLCFGSYGFNNVGYYNPPLINNGGTVENASTVITCPSTVCVIGDNSINAVNSKTDVNFYQICPGGKNGQMTRCYLDVTDPSLLDNVKSGKNGMLSQSTFRQDCPEAICYVIDASTGVQRIVKCNSINTPGTGGIFKNNVGGLATTEKYETIYSNFWDFILLIMFLLILFEFAYIEIHRYIQRSKTL